MTNEDGVSQLRILHNHFKEHWAPNGYPALEWAADEIERLRKLVRELRPYLETDVRSGLGLGEPWVNHESDDCDDCKWYNESLAWKRRIDSGELNV